MNILVLEASTTSAKAMLYHTDDRSAEVKSHVYTGIEDITRHDAEQIYQQMLSVGAEAAAGQTVDMISLGGTWHSLMLCTKGMVPVTPVYLWSYRGAADICQRMREDTAYVRSYYQKTGCMVNAIYPFFKLLHLRAQGKRLEDYLICGQGTYNNYRMTGQRVITQCLASGTGLLNIHTKQYDQEILAQAGISESQLCRVIPYDQTYPLLEEAARALGVRAGIPVVTTSSDGGLNQVGVGAMREGVMTFSAGTSGAIRLTTASPTLPQDASTWCYLSPKAYLSGAATNGCCNCIDYFKSHIAWPDASYNELEQGYIARSNETGPVFLPFLFGERCPGWHDERSGGFMHVLPHHNTYDLYHAVQEGVLYNLYQCYQALTTENGQPSHIHFSGGILRSERWSQMCADIFQAPLEVDHSDQGSLLGGAVLAMEIAGQIDDVCAYQSPIQRVILPNPDMAQHYRNRYEAYLACYEKSVI